jgi:cobalt-zinc-cadmium efflux system outer membrane protein
MVHSRNLCLILGFLPAAAFGQTAFTWQQVKEKFEAANPTLKAAQANIDESKANEVTAYLRPNPNVSTGVDQIVPFSTQPSTHSSASVYRPLQNVFPSFSTDYLIERGGKRGLRRDAAVETTAVTRSQSADQARGLLFNLRSAFVQVLQSKAVMENAKENLAYWDRELEVNRKRYNAGDLALLDLNRLEVQRIEFESDYETALVNLRTNKVQLLMLLNDHRTMLEQFDVTGNYDYTDELMPLAEYRTAALAARPDLRAAEESVKLADINHKLAIANGTADPTVAMDFARNPPIPFYFGMSVSIPVRLFDRNQGEKERTKIDIGRNERLRDAAEAQVFSDVDSAYWTLVQALNLLKPYKAKYLPLSEDNRNRVSVAYQNGGASLLDLLDAEKAYRDARLAYLNLIGSYLMAAAQMNMAAGREVLQ